MTTVGKLVGYRKEYMSRQQNGWIGVDLDGTIAEYTGWVGPTNIGPPIPKMIERVKRWIAEGTMVKIFTARVSDGDPEIIEAIERWCFEHIGVELPITNVKDYQMVELWDDRAVQVVPNTGVAIRDQHDKSSRELDALYAAGVDNWDGYDFAMEIFRGEQ